MQIDGVTFKIRRGTTTQWASSTSPLGAGEPGYDVNLDVYKIGDGNSLWTSLPAFIDKEAILALLTNTGGAGADPRIGNLADLSTSDRTTLVAAINEVNVPTVSLTALYNNAKAGS